MAYLGAAQLNERYNAAKQNLEPLKSTWLLNIAFYLGDQWTKYDAGSGKVRQVSTRMPRIRYISNIIRPDVAIIYARVTQQDPRYRVATRSSDQDDVAKAHGSKTMLDYFWDTNNYRKVFTEAALWAVLTGLGWVKVIFDPDAGYELPLMDQVYRSGMPVLDSCSPFEIFYDPYARNLSEITWLVQERIRPVEYVQRKYGVKVLADSSAEALAYASQATRVVQGPQGVEKLPSCKVREYWEVPSAEKPEGEYAVFVGNQILTQGPNPYLKAGVKLPFTCCRYMRVPGRLAGDTFVTDYRPIQVMYNMVRSDILENLMKVSNPIFADYVGALDTAPQFEAGEFILRKPNVPGELRQFKVDPFPPHSMNMMMRLMQEGANVSGVNDIARGNVPRGVRSADQMGYLVEQSDSRLHPFIEEYEDMVKTALTYVLWLAREYMELPVVLRVLGKNKTYEAMLFSTKDIPADADVIVDKGSALAQSGAALQQLAITLWDRGILRDPALVLRLTQYGALEEATGDVELDTAQAQRENERLKVGLAVPVEDFQNHIVHVLEHNRFRKTADYDEATEEIKAAFRVHVMMHESQMPAQLQAMEGGNKTSVPRGSVQQQPGPAAG